MTAEHESEARCRVPVLDQDGKVAATVARRVRPRRISPARIVSP